MLYCSPSLEACPGTHLVLTAVQIKRKETRRWTVTNFHSFKAAQAAYMRYAPSHHPTDTTAAKRNNAASHHPTDTTAAKRNNAVPTPQQTRDTVHISRKGALFAWVAARSIASRACAERNGNSGLAAGPNGAAPGSTAAGQPTSPIDVQIDIKDVKDVVRNDGNGPIAGTAFEEGLGLGQNAAADTASPPSQANQDEAPSTAAVVSKDKKEDVASANQGKSDVKKAENSDKKAEKADEKDAAAKDKQEKVTPGSHGNGAIKRAEKAEEEAEAEIQGSHAKFETKAEIFKEFAKGITDKVTAFQSTNKINQILFEGIMNTGGLDVKSRREKPREFALRSDDAVLHTSGVGPQGSANMGMNEAALHMSGMGTHDSLRVGVDATGLKPGLTDNGSTVSSRAKAALTAYNNRLRSEMSNTGTASVESGEKKNGGLTESIV